MGKTALNISGLIYTLLILLAAAVFASSVTDRVLAVALALAVLVTHLHLLPPRFDIVIDLAVIGLAPLALEPGLARLTALPALTVQTLAAAAVLPVYYRLDLDLKETARTLPLPADAKGERHITAAAAAVSAKIQPTS